MAGMFGRSTREAIPGLPKLSIADRAMIFGGALLNPALGQLIKDRKTIIPAQRDYMAELSARVAGSPERQVQMPVGNAEGEDISAAFSPQMETQAARAPLGIGDKDLPSLALRAQQLGIPIDGLLDVLKAQQPDMAIGPDGTPYNKRSAAGLPQRFRNPTNINGWIKDTNNPDNENTYSPNLPEGMIPDGKGGVAYPNGLVPQLAGREGAIAEAKAKGTAPYEFLNVPTPSGAPGVISKDRAAGGMFLGQTPTDAIRAEGAARGETERAQGLQDRAAAAGKQLSALDEMETLLPDVIAGFGSDLRLNTARAMALAGNEEAKKKVAATETFINQGRVLVAGIIKTFGSNPTEGERKFAEKMSGADATLNPETLKEGIRLQRARINRELQEAGKAAPGRPAALPRSAVEAELRRRGLIP
jgi:hypothetical protein